MIQPMLSLGKLMYYFMPEMIIPKHVFPVKQKHARGVYSVGNCTERQQTGPATGNIGAVQKIAPIAPAETSV